MQRYPETPPPSPPDLVTVSPLPENRPKPHCGRWFSDIPSSSFCFSLCIYFFICLAALSLCCGMLDL